MYPVNDVRDYQRTMAEWWPNDGRMIEVLKKNPFKIDYQKNIGSICYSIYYI